MSEKVSSVAVCMRCSVLNIMLRNVYKIWCLAVVLPYSFQKMCVRVLNLSSSCTFQRGMYISYYFSFLVYRCERWWLNCRAVSVNHVPNWSGFWCKVQSLKPSTKELPFRCPAVSCLITSSSPSLQQTVARLFMVGPGWSSVCLCELISSRNRMSVSAKRKCNSLWQVHLVTKFIFLRAVWKLCLQY
jgi:hypothetical protein